MPSLGQDYTVVCFQYLLRRGRHADDTLEDLRRRHEHDSISNHTEAQCLAVSHGFEGARCFSAWFAFGKELVGISRSVRNPLSAFDAN
jgi:hypothetical protein